MAGRRRAAAAAAAVGQGEAGLVRDTALGGMGLGKWTRQRGHHHACAPNPLNPPHTFQNVHGTAVAARRCWARGPQPNVTARAALAGRALRRVGCPPRAPRRPARLGGLALARGGARARSPWHRESGREAMHAMLVHATQVGQCDLHKCCGRSLHRGAQVAWQERGVQRGLPFIPCRTCLWSRPKWGSALCTGRCSCRAHGEACGVGGMAGELSLSRGLQLLGHATQQPTTK